MQSQSRHIPLCINTIARATSSVFTLTLHSHILLLNRSTRHLQHFKHLIYSLYGYVQVYMSFVLWSPGSDQAKLACTTQNTSAHRQSTQVQGRSHELSSAPEEQRCSRHFLMLPDGFMCRWWRRKGTVSLQASIRCFDRAAALQARPRPSATIQGLLVAGSTEGEKGTHSSL